MIVTRPHHRLRDAEQWNAAYPEGTAVRYFPIRGDFDHVETRTRSEAWTVAGCAIVKIEGFAGGVHIDHLVVVEDPSTEPTS